MSSPTEPLYASHPPPSPRPKRSLKRCALYTCLGFTLLISGLFSYAVYQFARTLISQFNDPHSDVIHTGDASTQVGANVVRPLILPSTKFDLALTVFARKPKDEEVMRRWLENARADRARAGWTEQDEKERERLEEATAAFLKVDVETVRYWGEEEVLWSGVVRRGLDMTMRPVDLDLEFDLPLEVFYEPEIFFRDVRLGVLLIPQSPSKLDRVEDWTYWKGDVWDQHASAVDDKILRSVTLDTSRIPDESNRLDLLEHLASSFSLLEFHNIPSNCTLKGSADGLDGEGGGGEDADEDSEEEDLWASIRSTEPDTDVDTDGEEGASGGAAEGEEDKSAENDEIATEMQVRAGGNQAGMDKEKDKRKKDKKDEGPGKHPYILTRSHLYLINETRPLDRKSFDKKHKNLLEKSCGRNLPNLAPSWMLCHRDYKSNGNWETRMSLLPAGKKGKKELAYAPFVGRLRHSAGPRDLIKIPINRETCNGTEPDRSLDPKTLHVKHHIKFSTISPGRLGVLENFVQSERVSHNATEAERVQSHDMWRQTVGLLGDRHEGVHPWRRLTLFLLTDISLFLPIVILTILYWYTRQTPTGLSHRATMLYASGWAFRVLSVVIWNISTQSKLDGFMTLLFDGWGLICVWFMFKLVWPVEWVGKGWWKGWMEGVRRTRWSHRERRGLRVEGAVEGWKIGLLFLATYLIIYIPLKYDLHLLSPGHPEANILPAEMQRWYASPLWIATYESLQLSAAVLQIYHNHQTQTFAGMYALAAQMGVAQAILGVGWYLPGLVGLVETREGARVGDALWGVVILVRGWQSRGLPRVEQEVKGGEGEDEGVEM